MPLRAALGRYPPPPDKYHAVYYTFVLLGVGSLLPWNAFITERVYYTVRFHQDPFNAELADNFETVFSLSYQICNFIALALCVPKLKDMPMWTQITLPLVLTLIVMVFTVVLVPTSGLSGNTMMYLTIPTVMFMGAAGAVYTAGIFGLAGRFPPIYTQGLMFGQGVSGLLASMVSFFTLVELPVKGDPSPASVGPAALGFFITSTIFIAACLVAYWMIQYLPFVRHFARSNPVMCSCNDLTLLAGGGGGEGPVPEMDLRHLRVPLLMASLQSAEPPEQPLQRATGTRAGLSVGAVAGAEAEVNAAAAARGTRAIGRGGAGGRGAGSGRGARAPAILGGGGRGGSHLPPSSASSRGGRGGGGRGHHHGGRGGRTGGHHVQVQEAMLCPVCGPLLLAAASPASVTSVAGAEAGTHALLNRKEGQLPAVVAKLWVFGLAVAGTFAVSLTLFPTFTSSICSVRNPSSAPPCVPDPPAGRIFGDLFTPLTFLVYTLGDTAGRYLSGFGGWAKGRPKGRSLLGAVAARVLLVPLLLMCNIVRTVPLVVPVVFRSDAAAIGLLAVLALSNGYLASVAMMHGPELVPQEHKETAGAVMTLALTVGLLVGSIIALVLDVVLEEGGGGGGGGSSLRLLMMR